MISHRDNNHGVDIGFPDANRNPFFKEISKEMVEHSKIQMISKDSNNNRKMFSFFFIFYIFIFFFLRKKKISQCLRGPKIKFSPTQ